MSARDPAATRDRILAAAARLLREPHRGQPTVRAVAQEAGVGVGTLRHHFPTQRALHDAVLAAIYREAMPDTVMTDVSIDATERLVRSLQALLAGVGVGDDARRFWSSFHEGFLASDDAPARSTYVDLDAQTRRRIEGWLAILGEEGALLPGDNGARARVLVAVVNGLALERGLPSDAPALAREALVLGAVVGAMLVAA